jgi:hypothetical protein
MPRQVAGGAPVFDLFRPTGELVSCLLPLESSERHQMPHPVLLQTSQQCTSKPLELIIVSRNRFLPLDRLKVRFQIRHVLTLHALTLEAKYGFAQSELGGELIGIFFKGMPSVRPHKLAVGQ